MLVKNKIFMGAAHPQSIVVYKYIGPMVGFTVCEVSESAVTKVWGRQVQTKASFC